MRPEIPESLAEEVREEAEKELGVNPDSLGLRHSIRALVDAQKRED